MRKTQINFKATKCEHCGQSEQYLLGLDRGSAEIMRAIKHYIEIKGVNIVHPRNEMEGQMLTSNQVGNLSRPRFHGLIARISGKPGNYCLTYKGACFLNNGPVLRFAIISKVTGHNEGYIEGHYVTMRNLLGEGERWEGGFQYEVIDGQVVPKKDEIKQPILV